MQNVVPVGVGLNISHPYVEQNYTQPTFAQCTYSSYTSSLSGPAFIYFRFNRPFIIITGTDAFSAFFADAAAHPNANSSTTTTSTKKSGAGTLSAPSSGLVVRLVGLAAAAMLGLLIF